MKQEKKIKKMKQEKKNKKTETPTPAMQPTKQRKVRVEDGPRQPSKSSDQAVFNDRNLKYKTHLSFR
jgi:hypothetical protein